MSGGRPRLAYVDALRGFAISGVIVAHAASLAGVPGMLHTLTAAGGQGVLLFFVISAFTISLTLERGMEREAAPYRNFFIKRAMRLVPVYWFGILLYTAVYGLDSRGWREGPELWHYPLHFTLTNILYPTTTSSVVPGGWSISCEALFYLAVPFLLPFARSTRSALILWFVACVAGSAMTYALQHFVAFPAADPALVEQFWYRGLPSQIGVFAAGIVLYRLVAAPGAVLARLQQPLSNVLALGCAAIILLAATLDLLPVPHQYMFATGFLILALCLSQLPWAIMVNRFTTFIGQISYSAYIFHFMVLKQVSDLLSLENQPGTLHFLILVLVSFPVTMALAAIGFRFIEQPTTRLAKRWVTYLESRPRDWAMERETIRPA